MEKGGKEVEGRGRGGGGRQPEKKDNPKGIGDISFLKFIF